MKEKKKSTHRTKTEHSKKISANLQQQYPVKKYPEQKSEEKNPDNDFHHPHAFINPYNVTL